MGPPFTSSIPPLEEISVRINGAQHKVPTTFSEVTLNTYLRRHLHLTGTKVMCREGGCGACIVHVANPDPSPTGTGQMIQHSVNSCLTPILSCDNWDITTVEGIGNKENPHKIQSTLAEQYGTQCGYCTPGMVMSMFSLLKTTPSELLTKQQVEDSLGGNLCRCTGYRPILDAFKSFAKGDSKCSLTDVEDVGKTVCKITGNACGGNCNQSESHMCAQNLPKSVSENATPWFKPASLLELFQLVDENENKNPYYVVGRTGVGVYNDGPHKAYIDLKGVKELYSISMTPSKVIIGANCSLTNLINVFKKHSGEGPGFAYLNEIADLVDKTAHPAIRNAGSWAGNLAMKNRHKDMPSDSFVGFMAADARIIIGQNGQPEKSLTLEEFLTLSLDGKIILRAEFLPKPTSVKFCTFKIMPRSQNSHSYVHAAFSIDVDSSVPGQFVVRNQPILAFGNISPIFVRARETEAFIVGKNLADVTVLQGALRQLQAEIIPERSSVEARPETKTSMSISLFYKFALEIIGDFADKRFRSSVGSLVRPLSSGIQSFETKKKNWPLTQPLPKLESLIQCTGEAKYISDIYQEKLLHSAFTLTERGNAGIYKLDLSQAMALPGVIKVFTANDIPGENDITVSMGARKPEEIEPFLATTQARYAGQRVAFVVAESQEIAEAGAELVKVVYTSEEKAISTIEEAIASKSFHPKKPDVTIGDAEQAIASAPQKIFGELSIGTQNHFHMETQVAVSYPVEDGINVESGTQYMDATQTVVARSLAVPKNSINVTCKRLGGGFGGKTTKSIPMAVATSLAAKVLKRPVKMHMSLWDNSKSVGKRYSWHMKYQAGFDNSGKISGVVMELYQNMGAFADAGAWKLVFDHIDNVYSIPAWKIVPIDCKTHIPNNTACRGPGSTEAVYFIEAILEHVAKACGKSAVEIKMMHYMTNGTKLINKEILKDCTIAPITQQLLESSKFTERSQLIEEFNKANRFRKRGIAMTPMRFPCHWGNYKYNAYIAIYHNGGTIGVCHGGIEMGQGINTKIAQVVAYELGIDLKYVKIETANSFLNANGVMTAGSKTSELASLAVMEACDQLKKRINPVRAKIPLSSWPEVVEACFSQGIDLSAHAWVQFPVAPAQYDAYGAMATEVEIDALTGEYFISRLDVLYDCGESMSPLVDIGQVEGAVVMGLGYYLTEEVIYDSETAANLTFGTWTYKPPTAKDIPVDFRVTLLPNAPNPRGVLRSKFVAEPPLCMTCSVVFALRNAITASRIDSGKGGDWFRMDAPLTPARVLEYCATDIGQLKYKE